MNFRQAISQPLSSTSNGMPTLAHSGNPLVDLFSVIGSSRGKDIRMLFDQAYGQDRAFALKIVLWARDIRGGAGERQTVRTLLQHLELIAPEDAESIIPCIPYYGRWDDLLAFKTDRLREAAYSVIAEGLADPSTAALVAKWLPRVPTQSPASRRRQSRVRYTWEEQTSYVLPKGLSEGKQENADNARRLMAFLHLRPSEYRKMLSTFSTVETLMCAGRWNEIEFGKLPSIASARYAKAFNRNCAERYAQFKNDLATGKEKINATAIFPHDVLRALRKGDAEVATAQWNSLPNYLGDDDRILPMVDTSASMLGGSGSVPPMDVAVALGLYTSDKQRGAFRDVVMTFSAKPVLEVLNGSLLEKYNHLIGMQWNMNTNLEAAFQVVLGRAMVYGVPASEMPKIILILSDMEFDRCVQAPRQSAFAMIHSQYRQAGYELPRVVFWNLNARMDNTPVHFRQDGTALVSGFSPALLKAVLQSSDLATFKPELFTAEQVMYQTVDVDRYRVVDDLLA